MKAAKKKLTLLMGGRLKSVITWNRMHKKAISSGGTRNSCYGKWGSMFKRQNKTSTAFLAIGKEELQ